MYQITAAEKPNLRHTRANLKGHWLLSFLLAVTFYTSSVSLVRLEMGGFQISPFLMVIVATAFPLLFRQTNIKNRMAWSLFWAGSFCLVVIISAFLNDSEEVGVFLVKFIAGILTMLIAYIFFAGATDSFRKTFLLQLLSFTAAQLLIHALYSFFVLQSPYFTPDLSIITEAGKNSLALVAGLGLVLSTTAFWIEGERKTRLTLMILAAIFGACLLYTFSRSGLVVALFSLLAFSIRGVAVRSLNLSGVLARGFFIFLGVIACLLALDIDDNMIEPFVEGMTALLTFTDSEGSSSLALRQEFLALSFQMFEDAPIIGNGIGAFAERYHYATHNSFSQLLAETGLVGTMAFLAFLLSINGLEEREKMGLVFASGVLFLTFFLFFQNALDFVTLFFIAGFSLAPRRAENRVP